MAARGGSKNGVYFCNHLISGTQALQAIDITASGNPNTYDLIDGDAAIVVIDGTAYFYRFNATSTEAESSPDFIRPNDYSAAGVWELVGGGHVATHVNNSNGNPNISDTHFDVDAVVAQNNFESIGPTGSGATNIWTALDAVPENVAWIEVDIWLVGTSTSDSVGQIRYVNFYARKYGSSQSVGTANKIAVAADVVDQGGNGRGESIINHKIPVSSRMFDATWVTNFNNGQLVDIHLTGYGY